MTYRALLIGVRVLGEKIAALGITGDAIGLMLPNANVAGVAVFATISAGRAPAMINYTAGAANILSGCRAARVEIILTSRLFIEKGRLDKLAEQIKKLREQTDALMARKRVIESLQANRAETVHLFNELAKQVPGGIYLKSVKQSSQKITLNGYTQSNARVSMLMRNLDESPLLEKPDLVEIKAVTVDKRRLGEFTLNVQFTRQTAEDGKNKRPAAQKPAEIGRAHG